ncbi:CRISPR-associated endonuclease Cas3'', partial [bacterium]|nr:CRISPR-associated endonuclease Cas3'' [candidate division CSSED10-310 bacterium]
MTYLARSAPSDDAVPQTYLEHVFHVLVRSRGYLRKILCYARGWDAESICRIMELAAEYHDLGKLCNENQKVLSGVMQAVRLPVPHSDAGVAYLTKQDAWLSALLVYAHHAGLPDMDEIAVRGIRNSAIEFEIDRELPELLRRHEDNVRHTISVKSIYKNQPILHPADIRVLFSCLTHADHGDAARASNEEPPWINIPKLRASERLDSLHRYVAGLSSEDKMTVRNRMRSEFFCACSAGIIVDDIAICDAPVGTGKTTAVMAHLLNVAIKKRLRRIFVILPFTNIITQSVKTYRKALTLEGEVADNVVAEIHHRADFETQESRRLTALWHAPIIVTTAVAFFETLASSYPSTLRRLQNLPGSAIFLDEAHAMLPVSLLPLAWNWIQHTASEWSCHWVLASGSLFHFWTLEEFKSTELQLPNILTIEGQKNLQRFEASRIRHCFCPETMNLEELAIWLKGLEGPIIIVLNTVHTAAAAANVAIKEFGVKNVMHISTSLIPVDRSNTLERVVSRLEDKSDTNWCLFATSCVEAGVDLSFKTGVRECASLLSLLQLAGRVNRNSEYQSADVWTITLSANDDGVTRNPSLRISARILREFFEQGREISPLLCTEAMRKEMR